LDKLGKVSIGTAPPYGTSRLTLVAATNPTTPTDAANQLSIGEASQNTVYSLKIGYLNINGGYSGSIQSISGGAVGPLLLNGSGGNVGIGTTNPANLLDVYQATTGIGAGRIWHVNGNAINIQPSYNYYDAYHHIFRGLSGTADYGRFDNNGNLIVGGNTASGLITAIRNTAGGYSAAITAKATGTANSQVAGYMFMPTFGNTTDYTPRRAADIWAGYNGGNWGTEYLAFGVGGAGDGGNLTTERMRITSAGIITTPNHPAFFAYNSATFTSTGTIPFNTTLFNIGNNYSTSTYRFTAPVTGVYWFNVILSTDVATTWSLVPLYVNGGRYRDMMEARTVPINGEEHASTILQLTAGDYVEVYSGGGNIQGGSVSHAYYSAFQGYLIG
jgi:hypothetical protein